MYSKIYLWIEDRAGKASYLFWKTLIAQLFPEIIIESKQNNSELVKAVKKIDDDNCYIIVMDNSFDNRQVYQEQHRLLQYAKGKNVVLFNIICFEYLLLEFDKLLDWIYAESDEFRDKRKLAIDARDSFVKALQSGNMEYKLIREVMRYDGKLDDHNVEQFSSRLLFDLTRNTGFEVSKGHIGECWIQSCCEWVKRQEDDICGLDNIRLSVKDKMKSIYEGTSLIKEFARTGLEVAV